MQILGFLPPRKSSYTPLGPKIALFVRPHRELHDAKNRKWLPRRIRVANRCQNTVSSYIYKIFSVADNFSRYIILVLGVLLSLLTPILAADVDVGWFPDGPLAGPGGCVVRPVLCPGMLTQTKI